MKRRSRILFLLLGGGNEVHDPHCLQLAHHPYHGDTVQVAFRDVSLVLFPEVLHKIRMTEVLLSYSDGEEYHLRDEKREEYILIGNERVKPLIDDVIYREFPFVEIHKGGISRSDHLHNTISPSSV